MTRLLAFFGHHKCASTWIHNILDAIAADAGWRLAYLFNEELFDCDLARYIERERIDFLSYVNADQKHVDSLPEHRGFHVVRDPRDLIASAYFSHKNSHPTETWPELVGHREKIATLSKDAALFEEMEFNAHFIDHIATWNYDQPHVLELRQEEFTTDPYLGFLRVFEFLGALDEEHHNKRAQVRYLMQATTNILNRLSRGWWPLRVPMDTIPGERVMAVAYDNRFQKFSKGRAKGKVDDKSHYRKGVGGDWINHFTPEHVAAFKERWPGLVSRLGYEADESWAAGSPS